MKQYIIILCALMMCTITYAQNDSIADSTINLQGITVVSKRLGTLMPTRTQLKTETITNTGLQKLACCNLSETFENSASATVSFTDAVSGAKQIQLLGLSGIYSQTMAENIPTMRGLPSAYALSYTPAPWLESIQIAKGASSVVNGYESITGIMNLEYKKPNDTEELFVNLYGDADERFEANVTAAEQVTKNLWTGLLLSGMYNKKEQDENGDTFMDMPKTKYINAYNRWLYENDETGIESRTGVKVFYDDRRAGQTHAAQAALPNGSEVYKSLVRNKGLTVENKTGISIGSTEGKSIGIINSFTHYDMSAEFGNRLFSGRQNSYLLNTLYASYFGNTNHKYTTGLSFAYDHYNTAISERQLSDATSNQDRDELVPGAFFEYTETGIDKLTAVAGLRTDYNSKYGWLITPRLSLKYDLNEHIILRASAGKGYHSPQPVAENIGLMASSRRFNVSDNLKIEKAWNYGASVMFNIPIWNSNIAKLSLDYYRTSFDNRIVIDTERQPDAVFFYNSNGASNYANVWQADLSATLVEGLELFAAFRYNNNSVAYTDGSTTYTAEQPLMSKYRGLVNLSYSTNMRRWVFDFTAQLNGHTRLPAQSGYGSSNRYSPAFPLLFAQVTKKNKRFDIYAGAENFLGYKQDNPILSWQVPFSTGFDASQVWGPITGARLYAGIRVRLGRI